ncbi:Thaumatin protein 1 [Spatholobus suberectus]|nr:Thaumatin protein 1 [Spatholobus suberectus]
MASSTQSSFIVLVSLVFFRFFSGSYAATLIITKKCSYTVWPAILSAAGTSPLSATGFALNPGDSNNIAVPPAWSGRLWGRTLCSHGIAGKFSCVTGDCGSSTIECAGNNAASPVTLVEFTLNGTGGLDLYGVSLVYGFNLPVRIEPRGGNCRVTGCVRDLNAACPIELKVVRDGEGVGCKNACHAEPCLHSELFKSACPGAHLYAYDHDSFTCASADYTINFCPTSSTSSIEPRNKKYPLSAVDNPVPGGHVDCSPINVKAVVVALASICGLFIAVRIKIRLSKGNCLFSIGTGTTTETTTAANPGEAANPREIANPQEINVELGVSIGTRTEN